MNAFRFWGTVAKDGSHIRSMDKADTQEMAEILLMRDWTPALRELYDVKPVLATVAADEPAIKAMKTLTPGRLPAEEALFPAFDDFVGAARTIQTAQPAQMSEAAERLDEACTAFEKAFKDWARKR